MQVTVRKVEDVAVIDLEGKYELRPGHYLLPKVKELVKAGEKNLLINIEKVSPDSVDDSFSGAMMASWAHARQRTADLKICGFSSRWQWIEVALGTVMRFYTTKAEALQSFNTPPTD